MSDCICIRPILGPSIVVVRKEACPEHGREADPETWARYDAEDDADANQRGD